MGFSRHEYWSGLPFASPGDLPNPGIESGSPTLEADALTSGQGLGGMAPSCSMEHQSGQLTEGWGTLFPDDSLTRPAPCCWQSLGAQLGLRGGSPQILSRWSPACACGHPHSTVVFSKGEHHKREMQAEAICLLWPNLGCHTFFSVFCSLKLAQRLTCSGGRDIDFTS